ncbi:MAG: shikimate dehydrogenase [Acidimicrobiales bacterium]
MPGRKTLLSGPGATTRVAGVIGDPVRHSLSPALHNAAFAALGLDWVYVAFHVPAGQGAAAVDAMRALGIAGLSVTMPHKETVARRLDHLGPTAAQLGVVNTVSRVSDAEGWQLEGESTDGAGFIDALRGDDGFDPAGRRCVVLGSGGSARSVTLALAEARAASVSVAGRRREQAELCAALAGPAGRVVAPGAVADAVAAADLVVNATPVGMHPADGLPFALAPELLGTGHFVADLIYAPAVTPLLRAARARKAGTANGLGMLIHQAARQVAIWTGRPAPLEVMSAAALAALSPRVST